MNTRKRIDRVTPLEKFVVLAGELDALKDRLDMLSREQSVDELLEVVDVAELGQHYGVSKVTMCKKLQAAGGTVFKLGKKQVIRKIKLLEVIETLEGAGCRD